MNPQTFGCTTRFITTTNNNYVMKRFMLLMALFPLLYACAPRVAVDYNNKIDYSKYRTFTWMDSDVKAGQNPLYYNQIATDNVENTVEQVMKGKGLKENTKNPDLLIGYHFFVEDKTRTVTSPNSAFYGPYGGWGRWGWGGWGPGYWGWGGQQQYQEQYKSGTVVVDMVDADTKKLVWRGSIEDAINNPANITSRLTKQVQEIVDKFPDRNS